MNSKLAKLANYRQIAGIAVAAIILTVIFVPLQRAEAFTVNTPTLPNANVNAVPTSAVGSTFEVTIDVAAGELISIDQVELVLDNGQGSVKQAFYNANGQRTSGSPTLTRGHINIDIPTFTTGYGYGYGFVADGVNFNPLYSYALVNPQYTFISGNAGGFNNPVGNSVTGFVGPGTITIQGKLNTAQMSVGAHTLDVRIHTGTGVDPDVLFSPQLSFTTTGNSALFNSPVNSNNPPAINVQGVGPVTLGFSGIGNPGNNVSIEVITGPNLHAKIPNIFTSSLGNRPTFNVGTGSGVSAGPIIVIDVSSLDPTGPITITIPYFPSQVPQGFTPTIFRYNEDTNQWEAATNVIVGANTITGTFNGLSPVVAGIMQTASPVTGGGSIGTGGGGGGGSVNLSTVTYPAEFFVSNPLKKVQLQIFNVVNNNGVGISSATPGQQISIESSFRNFQQVDQNYAIIIQVIDADGFTTDIGWSQGMLPTGERADAARSWTAGDSGAYQIRIFVWDGVSMSPTSLSEVTSRTFTVS